LCGIPNTKETEPNVPQITMQNDRGALVDLYVPRKCSATNRIIKAKDHASVQLNIADVDDTGRFTGESKTFALCGFIRGRAEGDDALNRLCEEAGIIKKYTTR